MRFAHRLFFASFTLSQTEEFEDLEANLTNGQSVDCLFSPTHISPGNSSALSASGVAGLPSSAVVAAGSVAGFPGPAGMLRSASSMGYLAQAHLHRVSGHSGGMPSGGLVADDIIHGRDLEDEEEEEDLVEEEVEGEEEEGYNEDFEAMDRRDGRSGNDADEEGHFCEEDEEEDGAEEEEDEEADEDEDEDLNAEYDGDEGESEFGQLVEEAVDGCIEGGKQTSEIISSPRTAGPKAARMEHDGQK
ncbi:unnamed protein product [Protopolystoma xenopodis]|uniref:Uncharacterized protein n=1 Tax=Protopolystoma xenopodis TaxID=117903 RepID=A0A3S5A421_9PLAT|nr:unnamed protein product [Protopolystoma xenopodis]